MTRGAVEAVSPFVDRSSLGTAKKLQVGSSRRDAAVRRFQTGARAREGSEFRDRIGLRLLLTPAIGPGTLWLTVQDGKLVAVNV
jgi:hypothetical protein